MTVEPICVQLKKLKRLGGREQPVPQKVLPFPASRRSRLLKAPLDFYAFFGLLLSRRPNTPIPKTINEAGSGTV